MKHDDHQKRLDACRSFTIGSQEFTMPLKTHHPISVVRNRERPAPQFQRDYGVQQMRTTDPWPNVPWKQEPIVWFRNRTEMVIYVLCCIGFVVATVVWGAVK